MMQEKTGQTAVFGGGCFWCTEAVFRSLKGVQEVMSGYTGGALPDPNYDQVLLGNSGHVESVKITFDPSLISYDDLLVVFFNTHDPTTLNRQGNDVGTQYASVIFYDNEEQKSRAEKTIRELNDEKAYAYPVVTDVRPLGKFYASEAYHDNYYENHKEAPYCQLIIAPKLEKMRERFANLLRSRS